MSSVFEILDLGAYSWVDMNGDGYGDAGGADLDGDGVTETYAFDTGYDGYVDTYAWDSAGHDDVIADVFMSDSDGDGILDRTTWDLDGDMRPDVVRGPETGGQNLPVGAPAPAPVTWPGSGVAIIGPAVSGPVALNPSVAANDPAGFGAWSQLQQDIANNGRIWAVPNGFELVREVW